MSVTQGGNPLITSIYDFSPEALGQLRSWIEQAGLAIPVNQVVGFTQFTPQLSTIDTSEACSSTTPVDLATVGPQITGLPAGKYLVFYGATLDPASATTGGLVLNINGSRPGPTRFIGSDGGEMSNNTFYELVTLTGDSGTIKVQYQASVGTQNYRFRSLLTLKYA